MILAELPFLSRIMVGLYCFIGFFDSYLSTKGRIKEYAVMRCLGMSRGRIFLLVFEELFLLTIIGSNLGFLTGYLLDGGLTREAITIGSIELAHEENRCVIIVTHDPAVTEVADVAIRMKNGKLLESV